MRTAVYDCAASLEHRPPGGHPEHAGRYEAARAALEPLNSVAWPELSGVVPEGAIGRFHTADHMALIERAGASATPVALDPDTWMAPGSLGAARAAVSAACQAVDEAMRGEIEAGFVLARPPGHHAEPGRPMGFCLFNTIAIAACHALEAHGLERVAIVDIDVHHGNGTQCLAEKDERVFFASLHQAPLYPGTGQASETGLNGNIVNCPIEGGTAGAAWKARLESAVLPGLRAFRPEFVLVSAGFDAHADDPVGGLRLNEQDFSWSAEILSAVAREFGGHRLVSVMEGGYDCPALGRSAAAFVSALASA